MSRKTSTTVGMGTTPRNFSMIVSKWGLTKIDLFATREYWKVPNYFSQKGGKEVVGIDALVGNRSFHLAYTFPPLVLIPKTDYGDLREH